MIHRIIIAVKGRAQQQKLRDLLQTAGRLVVTLNSDALSWANIDFDNADLVLVSRSLIPTPHEKALERLTNSLEAPMLVVLTGSENPAGRANLLAAGCEAVFSRGLDEGALSDVLAAILRKREEILTRVRDAEFSSWQPRLSDFSSNSDVMKAFMKVVRRVTKLKTPLLILGETGVGKEWLARAIHANSPRAEHPFVAVNCGALTETLLASELFGHEKGSFTGADRMHRGLFEQAHLGTIFLDEIAELPYHLQVKLLRAVQEKEIQRVGSEKAIKMDVRIITATNRDIAAEVEAQRFRQDLYYRLGVLTLTVPPLRQRREDIVTLANSYVDYYLPRVNVRVEDIAPEALEALCRYAWPGNVRELSNVIERAMILCSGKTITLQDLPEVIGGLGLSALGPGYGAPVDRNGEPMPPLSLREARKAVVADFERHYLQELLASTKGHIGETARLAGLGRRALFGKMQSYGLRKEDFRDRSSGE